MWEISHVTAESGAGDFVWPTLPLPPFVRRTKPQPQAQVAVHVE